MRHAFPGHFFPRRVGRIIFSDRIFSASDLFSSDLSSDLFHQICDRKFRLGRGVPVFTHCVRTFFVVAALTVAMALPVCAQRQSAPPPPPPADRNTLGAAPADEDEA